MNAISPPAVFLAAVLVAVAARAENSPATRLSLKGLDGVALRVEPVAATAQKDGLTARAMQTAVQSQLRRARLPVLASRQQQRSPRRPCLRVNVATSQLNTGEHLYSIQVEVVQWVNTLAGKDSSTLEEFPVPAKTWAAANTFGLAPAEQLRRHVEAALGKMVDEFIDAYYQANPSETAFRLRNARKLR